MEQWLYRRVMAFYVDGPAKKKGEQWRVGSRGSLARQLLPHGDAPLNPHRERGNRSPLGWLAWDEDFDHADSLDEVLASLGQYGWELVGIQLGATTEVSGMPISYYVFKKPIDWELVEQVEEQLAVADSEPTYTQEEIEEHIRQWRA